MLEAQGLNMPGDTLCDIFSLFSGLDQSSTYLRTSLSNQRLSTQIIVLLEINHGEKSID